MVMSYFLLRDYNYNVLPKIGTTFEPLGRHPQGRIAQLAAGFHKYQAWSPGRRHDLDLCPAAQPATSAIASRSGSHSYSAQNNFSVAYL